MLNAGNPRYQRMYFDAGTDDDDIDYIDDIDDIDDIDIVHLGVFGQGCIRLRLWVHSSAAWNEYLSI